MMRAWLAAALLLFGAVDSPSTAQGPENVITIPGGIAAFRRVAGLGNDDHAPGAVVADYARVFYKSASDETAGTREIADYFEFLEKLTSLTSRWQNGVSFAAADANKALNEQFKDFADLVGIRLRNVDGKRTAELETGEDQLKRQGWLAAIGIDAKALVTQLNAGSAIRCPIPTDDAPLPFAALFRSEVFPGDRFPLLRLVSNRSASLFYMGMLSLDTETRQFVERDLELGKDLLGDRPEAFAVFGRSLHIRAGVPHLPGGPDTRAVWEELIGERLSKPANFLKSALRKDDGRMAYFLDVVTHLDEPHQQFVLGAGLTGKQRVEFVRDVYDAFKGPMDAWKVQDRPFLLPGFGAPLAIAAVALTNRGTLGPDWFPAALALVDDSHDFPLKPKARKLKPARADARWLFQWLNTEPASARRRFALLRFAQRRLMQEQAFTPSIELTLRTFSEMPSLALALERMGITQPSTYAGVGAAAWTLSQSGDRESVEAPMRRWQGAIALLEQTTRRQRLASSALESMMQPLVAVAALPAERARGRIADWLFATAIPAIAPDVASRPGATIEARVLHGLAVGSAPAPEFKWEGLSYRLATGAVTARDASAIRESAPGPTLDDLAALREVRAAILTPLKAEQLPKLAGQLDAVAGRLAQLKNDAGESPSLVNDLRDWAADWRKLKPKDVAKTAKLAPKIAEAIDEVSAIVLPRMVYALAVTPTSQPSAIFATIADRHQVAPASTTVDWHGVLWRRDGDGPSGGGTALRGTLLGIDLELADSQLLQGSSGALLKTRLNPADHFSWLSLIALSRADAALDEQARILVSDAMRRGRERVATLVAAGPGSAAALEAALVAAGTSETRAALAAFEVRRQQPARVAPMLRPMDFYQMGTTSPWPAVWGGAPANTDGCLCLTSPMRRSPESWLGSPGSGVLAASMTDATARLAEVLTDMKLPGWLVAPLTPAVVTELLRNTNQFGSDDWEALLWSRKIDAARVEEWLLALVASGILAPPAGGGQS